MLQSQDLRVDQEKEFCIKINIRELDRVPSIELSTLYILSYWSMLQYH